LQSAKHALDDTVERMQGLVDGFRERQETVIVKIMTDVSDVLRALVRQTEVDRLIAVQLVEDYGEGTNRIWADPFFLANAFRVLLENAVHAMPEGGWLTLRTRPHAGGGVVVEIEDTGIGMTQEFIDRELFAPFRSSKGHGLGLGMYICQHIIRLHEGEIEVESQPGCGTRFRLTFPSGAEPNA
jgi:signal transduction histidine kinase